MDQQQLLEYYKESYYHEFEHKDSINNRVSIPAGILPLLAAADIYLINHVSDLQSIWRFLGSTLVILFSCILIAALFFIIRTLYNHPYGYTATPQVVYEYRKSLEEQDYSSEVIEEEMTDYLSSQFAEYGSLNRSSNLSKVLYLRFVYFCLVGSLFVGILCIPVFTLGKQNDSDVTKVKIIDIQIQQSNN